MKQLRRIFIVGSFLLLFLDAFPQSWESIKDNEAYYCGEGSGSTKQEADQAALADLISQISLNVSSQSERIMEVINRNGELDEKMRFTHSTKTASFAILNNAQRQILMQKPVFRIGRWIKKEDVDKMFESRKRMAKEYYDGAVKAEKKGQIDVVLRDYYWALTLLRTLPNPDEERDESTNRTLTVLIRECMDQTFRDLKITACEKLANNDWKLTITYKGKPVNSLDFTYYDGGGWSSIVSAKDGDAVIELQSGFSSKSVSLRYEYEFKHQDSVIDEFLEVVGHVPMPKSQEAVALKHKEKLTKAEKLLCDSTFTTNSIAALEPPKCMGKEASEYVSIVEKMVKAVGQKNYSIIKDLFTVEGWDMFQKLLMYGNAKVLDSHDIRFYRDGDNVMERGLKMSFSFASGVRKSFVEDVVLSMNAERKIYNIAFGLGKTAEDDILNNKAWKETPRFAIMNFLENYKTAYALKRLDYISSIFDDDAKIFIGSVIKKADKTVNIENQPSLSQRGQQIVRKNKLTKDEYLKRLRRCFERNEFVNLRFASNEVTKLGKGGEFYSIQIAQDYYSSTYNDKGYLLLMVDLNDSVNPLIKVRTWQAERDPKYGLYEPGDFN